VKILHLTARYWPAQGGAESYAREISTRLAAEGHTVTVATTDALEVELFWDPHRRRLTERQIEASGVLIKRFPVRHLVGAPRLYAVWRYLLFYGLAAVGLPNAWLGWLSRYTPYVPELWRWLSQTEEVFDVVVAFGILYEPLIYHGRQLARRRSIPFVVCPFTHLGAGPQPARDAVSRYYTMPHQVQLVTNADAMLAMTPTEGEFYVRRGLPKTKVIVTGAGIDPQTIGQGQGKRFRDKYEIDGPIVALIASLSYDKGAIHLLEAGRHLWRAGLPVNIVLVGAVLKPFHTYFENLPAADRARVYLLGSLPEADKCDLLDALDILAMPSRTDSFGIAYLEAWLYGKPVIGAQAWGMSDLIAVNEDGLLVPFGDALRLAEAIRYLLAHPAESARLGQNGRAKALARYTWDDIYKRAKIAYSR